MPVFLSTILAGRAAVVTGAARGIGRCAAVALAQAGADVVGVDLRAAASPIDTFAPATRADLDYAGDLVTATGRRWMAAVADQRDTAALRAVAAQVRDEWDGVDILFANAPRSA